MALATLAARDDNECHHVTTQNASTKQNKPFMNKKLKSVTVLALLASTVLVGPFGCSTDKQTDTMKAASNASYPLTKCVVSGEDLGDKPYVFTHNGQTVKLCCKDCLAKFNQEPDKYMAKITEAK